MKTRAIVLGAAVVLAGCAGGKLKEADAARQAAEAALASCQTSSQTCNGELRACVETRDRVDASLAACEQKTAAVKTDVDVLEGRANELRDKLQSEMAAKNVEIEELKGRLTVKMLDRILFKSGSAEILPEGKAALAKVAGVLATTPDLIRVEGHTDTKAIGGSLKAKYPSNWELSAARAASVVRLFEIDHKIDARRLEVVGLSQFHPVAEGDKPEDLQRNRRVEIVLTSPKVAK
jgi:chemotaxis protein MotB